MSNTYAHRHDRDPKAPRWKRRIYRKRFPCGEKRCFPDEIAARVGGMLSIEERKNATQLWVYDCVRCKRWHLTSKPRGDRWAVIQTEKRKKAA